MGCCSNHLTTGPSGNKINCFPLEQLLDVYMVKNSKQTGNIKERAIRTPPSTRKGDGNEGHEVTSFTRV